MEKIYADSIIKLLSNDFYIVEQVYGTHFSGARLRIDAIVKPKDISNWKNPNVCFGIEFKLQENLKDTHDSTHWIKHALIMQIQSGIILDTFMSSPALPYLKN